MYIHTEREREREMYGMQEGMGAKIFTVEIFSKELAPHYLSLPLSHTRTGV